MIIIIGEPLILPYSTAKEACNSLVKEYKDASITAEIGQLSEDIAYGLVSKLNGECFLAPKGSAMDCVLKGDIILRIGDKALVWQVKSSQKGADKHFSLARNNGFRGKRFPLPGVIVVDSEIRKVNNIVCN